MLVIYEDAAINIENITGFFVNDANIDFFDTNDKPHGFAFGSEELARAAFNKIYEYYYLGHRVLDLSPDEDQFVTDNDVSKHEEMPF